MKINVPYDISDIVYYWSDRRRKVLVGRIDSVSVHQTKEHTKATYYIKAINDEDSFLSEPVTEDLVFRNKDAILDFAVKITEVVTK